MASFLKRKSQESNHNGFLRYNDTVQSMTNEIGDSTADGDDDDLKTLTNKLNRICRRMEAFESEMKMEMEILKRAVIGGSSGDGSNKRLKKSDDDDDDDEDVVELKPADNGSRELEEMERKLKEETEKNRTMAELIVQQMDENEALKSELDEFKKLANDLINNTK